MEKKHTTLESAKKAATNLSRRDFLKLSALFFGSYVARNTMKYVIGSEELQIGYVPSPDQVEPNKEKVEQSKDITQALKKISTLLVLYKDDSQRQNLLDYFLVKYGVTQEELDLLLESESHGVRVDDVATVFESLETSTLADEVKSKMIQNGEISYTSIIDFLTQNSQKADWADFIETNNLGQTVLSLGIKGKSALVNLGVDIDSYSFQESLLNLPEQKEAVSPQYTINHYRDEAAPHNDVININTPDSNNFYQFTLSLEAEKLPPSEFILNRLETLDGDKTKLSKSQTKEFVSLENWIYLEYKVAVEKDPTLTAEFYLGYLQKQLNHNNPSAGGLQGRLNQIYSGLVDAYGISRAQSAMEDILKGSPKTFKDVIEVLPPAVKAIFHTKSAHLLPPTTYQMILQGATEKGVLNFNNIPDQINKFSGNLYLEKIVDRRAVEGEIIQYQVEAQSKESGAVISALLNDKKTIEDYASEFFGNRKVVVADENGEPKGVIINGRVTEPVVNIPVKLLDILDAVEGERWKNGKEYLATIFKRNLIAPFTDAPASGGSDRIMQLVEMVFPSPYDGLTSLSDEITDQYPFRRPDLYGLSYLTSVLVPAVRDGLPIEEIYQGHDVISSKTLNSSSPINLLCAKLESYLLARDLVEKYGKERLDRLYIQFVPIGIASGEAAGIQMQGLEAGANYYFGKNLENINEGEMSILVGMIQSPIKYRPTIWNGVGWIDNREVCFERAEKVASLSEQKRGLSKTKIMDQISQVHFTQSPPSGWSTTFTADEINNLKPGTLEQKGTKLDLGIQVLREQTDQETVPKFPSIIELPNRANPEQELADKWFNSILDKELLRLETKEKSEASEVLNAVAAALEDGIGNHDQMVLNLIELAKTIDSGFDYQFWNGTINGEKVNLPDIRNPYIKGDPKYDLWNNLYELKSANYWQCGQCGLIMNSFLRLKTGHKVPTMLAPGNVKNWLAVLGSNEAGQVAREYLKLGDYEVISLDKKKKGQTFTVENPIELFQVGDIVVSWKSKDYGHATTVIDKGVDSQGNAYITVFDANYESTGKVRRQTIWAKDLATSMYPGRPLHMALIRPANLNHGTSVGVTESDRNFVNKVFTANVNGEKAILPVFEQTVEYQKGKFKKIINPGVAITGFTENGISLAVDNTNTIGRLPVPAGNALKPFVYAFALLKEVDPKKEVSIYPGEHSLDGSDNYVTNTSAQGFNLQGVEGKATFEEALACSIDVPFQIIFKDLMASNPNTWDEFQGFLEFFGIPLIDWQGNKLDRPSPYGATGLDVQVENLDKLGFALTCLMNPEQLLADQNINPKVIEAFKQTRDTLLNQKIRDKIMINDDNPIKEDVGTDITSPSMTSGINQVQFQGEKFVWQGTNLSDTFQGIAFQPTNSGVNVTISVAKGQLIREDISQSFNLNSLDYHSSIIGVPGLALTTTQAATIN